MEDEQLVVADLDEQRVDEFLDLRRRRGRTCRGCRSTALLLIEQLRCARVVATPDRVSRSRGSHRHHDRACAALGHGAGQRHVGHMGAATGLHISEAIGLDRDDVDLLAGVLSVRHTKFDKSRFAPVHDSTRRALKRYEKQRGLIFPRPSSPAFLLSERGIRVTSCSAHTYRYIKAIPVALQLATYLRPSRKGLVGRPRGSSKRGAAGAGASPVLEKLGVNVGA